MYLYIVHFRMQSMYILWVSLYLFYDDISCLQYEKLKRSEKLQRLARLSPHLLVLAPRNQAADKEKSLEVREDSGLNGQARPVFQAFQGPKGLVLAARVSRFLDRFKWISGWAEHQPPPGRGALEPGLRRGQEAHHAGLPVAGGASFALFEGEKW